MEQHAASNEALLRATQHLQQLLLRTPGKSAPAAASEAQAIANLAFSEDNPVRELFVTATPRREIERPRSPSPTATIRPKSSKAFFKFGRGSRDKSSTAPGSSSGPKLQSNIEGVTPLFEQCFGPIEEKRPKRKERASDLMAPGASAGPTKTVPVTTFSAQQKPARTNDQYRCIVCEAELSSKGVCKRHLEDQHITPKVYQCEGCHAYFDTKAEAKKHCGQCCGDSEHSWVATNLTKKVYACEYTGSYFLSKERYSQHLLAQSESRGARPQPNLNVKLEAIFRHASLLPLCAQVSQSLFGSQGLWEELQWEPDYLRAKITGLEHATFNPDGTVESVRWSAPKRRNTESFLTQLFQRGRLPAHRNNIKPEAMSICSTPMPNAYTASSIASGSSSADTPLRVTSPMARAHSRQAVWSPDVLEQVTSASTARSTPARDDVMTAELKSKRHLSDESRAYIPARTPPGPPEPLEQYQYHSDPSLMSDVPQIPPLPTFTTHPNSSVSLPLRKQEEGNGIPHLVTGQQPQQQHYQPIYQLHPTNSSHTIASDTGSETSTLAQSYREPEFAAAVPMDYSLWQQQQLAFQQQQQQQHHLAAAAYPYGNFDYSMPDDASIVASSINTGNTIGVDYVTEIPKMENYSDMDLARAGGTFFLDGHDGREEEIR